METALAAECLSTRDACRADQCVSNTVQDPGCIAVMIAATRHGSDGCLAAKAEQAEEEGRLKHDRDDDHWDRRHLHLPSNPDLDRQKHQSDLRTNHLAQMADLRRSNMQNYCYRPGDAACLALGRNLENAAVLRTVEKHLKHELPCLTL